MPDIQQLKSCLEAIDNMPDYADMDKATLRGWLICAQEGRWLTPAGVIRINHAEAV